MVKLKPIHHLNEPQAWLKTKMVKFAGSDSVKLTMEKKDIIILAAVLAMIGLNLYRRYAKKKGVSGGFAPTKTRDKSSLSGQPDDYEPYSGKKQGI